MRRNNRREEIKNRAKAVIEGCLFFAMIVIIIPLVGDYNDTHYTMKGEVCSIFSDEITVMDKTGNLWDFSGDGYTVGENVRITFYTNHTNDTRKDDEVVKVSK